MESTIKRRRSIRSNNYARKKINVLSDKKILKIIKQFILSILIFIIMVLIKNVNSTFTSNISNKINYIVNNDSDFNTIVVSARELFGKLNITNERLKSVFSENELINENLEQGQVLPNEVNEKVFDYTLLKNFNFTKPTEGILSSGFGGRINPITSKSEFHFGIDIAANEGENIYCIYDGVVEKVDNSDSLGNYVKIRHQNNLFSLYAHALSISVKENELVSKGEVIGQIGSTGWSEGPHLHFELLKDNKFVNCEELFNFSDNEGVIIDENNS